MTVSPSKVKGQRNRELESFFYSYRPYITRPVWWEGTAWRNFVRSQPVAHVCKITIVDYIQALDWQIIARDSSKNDELKSEIDHYTEGFRGEFGVPYDTHIDLVVGDLLDLPFGGASELIRENDDPDGRVLSVLPLDGATLFPTLSEKLPVGQLVPNIDIKAVYFPEHAIARMMMNARGNIDRKGWGMPPSEAIYQTIMLMNRGDTYYANLLLDTPPPGILDLGDMEQQSALDWVDSFKETLSGIDVFKIPVLYEHTTQVNWLAFGKPPTDLQFDRVTMKLAALICAGYGITLSDIGFQEVSSGGDSLAGSIRSERKSRRTGYAVVKKKTKAYFESMLPKDLEFKWVDYDDELNVAIGRARLSSATAWGQLIDKGIFTAMEARRQMVAEGLVTIPVPEEPDKSELVVPSETSPERPGMLGAPQPPSMGGHGEITRATTKESVEVFQEISPKMMGIVDRATDVKLEKLIKAAIEFSSEQIKSAYEVYGDRLSSWNEWYDEALFDQVEIPVTVQKAIDISEENLEKELEEEDWWLLEDFDKEVIYLSMLSAYNSSLQQNGREIANSAFSMGLSEIPEPVGINFNLENRVIQAEIKEKATILKELLDDGTKYFLLRITLSEIRKMLSRDEYRGIDTDTLMRDNIFVGTLVQNIRQHFDTIQEFRSRRSAEFEIGNIYRKAVEDLFRKSGLTLKRWITTSIKPCNVCLNNESQGFVDLNFEYNSQVFGKVFQPLAHPDCQCLLGFSEPDLNKQFSEGKFRLWDGK